MCLNILVFLFSLVPFAFGISICPTREVMLASGQVTSPNHPSDYPPNTDCTLTIKQPLDTNFTFTFSKMDIEGDDDAGELACYDKLEISGMTTKEFCSTTTPSPFSSGLNVVTLRMESDASVEQTGFDLSFTSVRTPGLPPAVSVCPTREINPANVGRVHSPGYAANYNNSLDCKLTLKVPLNKEVEVTYTNRDIEFASPCSKDKLVVADSVASSQTCGTSSESSSRTYSNGDVSFHFTTDGDGSGKGFILTYKLIDKPVPSCSCVTGSSYIKRTISQNNVIRRQNDDIALEFKTTQANGLFLYAKGGVRDFILLKLQDGNVVFEIDLGTGNMSLTVPTASLDDNAWHKVVVVRRGKSVSVTVDSLSQVTGQTRGSFTFLDIKPQNNLPAAMYSLGGPSSIRYPINFQGCVRNFEVDKMKPVQAYLQNDSQYTLYGSSSLGQC